MNILTNYALAFVGTRYKWGGDTPMGGFDCSGLIQEILKSAGIDPPGDQNVQAYYTHFVDPINRARLGKEGPGALLFYGSSTKTLWHITFQLDRYRMVEAGGGDSATINLDQAIAQGAYVRVRPIRRKDLQAVIMPDYSSIGML